MLSVVSAGRPDEGVGTEATKEDQEREHAWDELHAATPAGWWVGSPSYHNERREWLLYAFDPSERAVVGVRQREWTAIAESEVAVVREMARCLGEIRAGRAPK